MKVSTLTNPKWSFCWGRILQVSSCQHWALAGGPSRGWGRELLVEALGWLEVKQAWVLGFSVTAWHFSNWMATWVCRMNGWVFLKRGWRKEEWKEEKKRVYCRTKVKNIWCQREYEKQPKERKHHKQVEDLNVLWLQNQACIAEQRAHPSFLTWCLTALHAEK